MASGERVTVRLTGGGPWGFRLQGGSGTGKPLTVSKIRRKSRAHNKLQEDDLMVSINGVSCESQSHDQAMTVVDEAGDVLHLEIFRAQTGKENIAPRSGPPQPTAPTEQEQHRICNTVTNEKTRNLVETSTKIFDQKQESEDLRLQPLVHQLNETKTTKDVQPLLATSLDAPFTFPIIPKPYLHTPSPLTLPNATDIQQDVNNILTDSLKPVDPETTPNTTTPEGQREFKVETESGPNSFHQVTTERTKGKQGNAETSSFKQEERSYSRQEFPVTSGTQPLDTIKSTSQTSTTATSESSIFKVTKFEAKQSNSSETRQIWRPTSPVFNQPLEPPQMGSALTDDHTNYQSQKKKVPPPVPPKPNKPSSAPAPTTMDLTDSVTQKETISSEVSQVSEVTNLVSSHSSEHLSNPYMPSPETDEDMGSIPLLSRRRKTFSSSSFYEEPHSIYPTVEEQVELCRKIADSLSDDTNVKSKGANMFYKRVKRSHKWIHQGPDAYLSDGGTTDTDYEPQTPDPSQLAKAPYIRVSKGPPKLKLILDPREILDLQKLRNSGVIINEHSAVSPDICLDLVRDLNSPCGRGAALFAKRKQKAEEWVVDEEKVKAKTSQLQKMAESLAHDSLDSKLSGYVQNPRVKLIKSPWEAALESPIGSCDGAFVEVSPVYGSNYMAQTIIQAAEKKVGREFSPVGQTQQYSVPAYAPVAPISVDIYRPKAPRGWMGTNQDSVPVTRVDSEFGPPMSKEAPVPLTQSNTRARATSRPVSFHDFNSIPKTWSTNRSERSEFRPVKPPTFL